MTTCVFDSVQHLIDYLIQVGNEKPDHIVLMSADLCGQLSCPTKRSKSYKIAFGINGDLFKTEDLRNLTGDDGQLFVVAIVPESKIDMDKLEEVKKVIT